MSVSAKLKLVDEELASRAAAKASLEDKAAEDSETSELSSDEDIELDGEVEDGVVEN